MKGKIAFVLGAAVGYVLGTRAGRQRYEQIKAAATKVWESPGIQRQVQQAQDYAARKVGEIPGAIFGGAKRAMSGSRGGQTRTAPAGTPATAPPENDSPTAGDG